MFWCFENKLRFLFFSIYFSDIQATTWNVTLCIDESGYTSALITLSGKTEVITVNSQRCSKTYFKLNTRKPSLIKISWQDRYMVSKLK